MTNTNCSMEELYLESSGDFPYNRFVLWFSALNNTLPEDKRLPACDMENLAEMMMTFPLLRWNNGPELSKVSKKEGRGRGSEEEEKEGEE